MTEYTRPATWDDLVALVSALEARAARYALIGGYAVAAHGYNRFSEDLDFLVDPSPDTTERWVAALCTLPDRAAEALRGAPQVFEREGHYAIRINDEITVDIMPAACGHAWDELKSYAVRMELADGLTASVLSLEGLLLTKEGLRGQGPRRASESTREKLVMQPPAQLQ